LVEESVLEQHGDLMQVFLGPAHLNEKDTWENEHPDEKGWQQGGN